MILTRRYGSPRTRHPAPAGNALEQQIRRAHIDRFPFGQPVRPPVCRHEELLQVERGGHHARQSRELLTIGLRPRDHGCVGGRTISMAT